MFLYNIIIRVLIGLLNIVSLFNAKAKLWVQGRKQWRKRLKRLIHDNELKNVVWFHSASLGEFEQGRPVIEEFKKRYPQYKIVLTFFSPSGYESQRHYSAADLVFYLPMDTPSNASDFLQLLQPKMVFFVKYEFWLNYLTELKKQQIPTYLISGVFKKHQPFFKWYGGIFVKALDAYTTIFVQDTRSKALLKQLKITNTIISGDTRFDRVLEIAQAPKPLTALKEWCANQFVIVVGSSWKKDEHYALEAYKQLCKIVPNIKLIIVPHEVDAPNIERLQDNLSTHQFQYDVFSKEKYTSTSRFLLVDQIGYLSSIYQYANVAMIGGGFNNGIHNILEAIVYGIPVLFGPNYHKFNEAHELLALHVAFSYQSEEELMSILNQLKTPEHLDEVTRICKNYVQERGKVTQRILDKIHA